MNKKDFEQAISGAEAIIFDYGGVFVDIEHKLTIEKVKAKSSRPGAEKLYGKHAQTDLFDRLEVGRLSGAKFLEELKDTSGFTGSLEELEEAWCAMLKDHPWQRLEYIRELSRSYRLFMLSNINEIHEKFLLKKIADDPKLSGFFEAFEKVYFSHHIKLRKPDPEVFKLVLEENGLAPQRTVFVDDTPGHVESARKLGLRGIHLDPPNTFVSSWS